MILSVIVKSYEVQPTLQYTPNWIWSWAGSIAELFQVIIYNWIVTTVYQVHAKNSNVELTFQKVEGGATLTNGKFTL